MSSKTCGLSKKHPMIDGKPVVDSKQPLTLIVSHADIEKGTKKDGTCCALANTFTRAFASSYTKIMKTRVEVCLPDEDGQYRTVTRYTIDGRTSQFIKDFDAGKKVSPGKYVLQAVRPSEKLNSELKKKRNEKARLRKKKGLTKSQKKRKPKKLLDTTTRTYAGRNTHKWNSDSVASKK